MIIGIASADYLREDRSHDGQAHWGGSGWARVGQYIEPWRATGHDVVVGTMWREPDCLSVERHDGHKAFPDVVILQRLMHEGLDDAIKLGQKAGQIVVNDLDDWYWGLDPRNEAFLASHPKYGGIENRNNYKQALSVSDLVVVSTPYLADRIAPWTRGAVVVVPNYVETDRFQAVPLNDSTVPEVGWVGSTGHRSGDLEILRGVVGPLVRDGKITMYHGGNHVQYPSFASLADVPEESVRTADRTMAQEYPTLMTCQVGLVPLRDTPFNRAKSDIKGLEYAASGIPFVASDLPSYSTLSKEYGLGLLAKRPRDWVRHLEHLRDPLYRNDLSISGLERVKARDIKFGIAQTLDVLESL